MMLRINKTAQEYPDSFSLFSVLEQLGKTTQTGIAVAVNNRVVPKNDWETQALQDQDTITIITATQGG